VTQRMAIIQLHDGIVFFGRTVDMISIGSSIYLKDLLALIYLACVCGISCLTYRYAEDSAGRFFNRIALLMPMPAT
jgi:hypothetical protein